MVHVRRLSTAEEAAHCIELGVEAFSGSSQDQIIERLFNLRHNGRGWRERKASALSSQIKPELPEGHACFVAEQDNGQVIGFVTVTTDKIDGVGLIPNLAVDAAQHSQGVGRALIAHAVDWMQAEGMTVAKIETLAANAVGRWLYPACGFTEVVRQVIYAMPLQAAPDAPAVGQRLPLHLSSLHLVVQRAHHQLPTGATISWRAEEVGVGSVESADAATALPVASAIKTFLMAAMFHKHKGVWDQVPPNLSSLLAESDAIAMWDPRRPEWQACAYGRTPCIVTTDGLVEIEIDMTLAD